ncbi:MAG: efflux RND transporter periplasmic adaptor subunit [Planctomycetaceae bacterium]
MKSPRVTVILILLGTLVSTVTGCSRSATQAMEDHPQSAAPKTPGPSAPVQPPALVRAAIVREEKIAPEFRALGNVRPRFESVVASGSDGIVEQFPIEVGDFVTKGTLLSQLRNESTNLDIAEQEAVLAERKAELAEISVPRKEDEAEAEARKLSAEIAYSNAARRMEELTALSKRGAANQSEVKDAEDTLDAAVQTRLAAAAILSRVSNPRPETVLRAKSRVEAQENQVAFLKAEREKRSTRAPFTGFVVEEHTYIGQWLSKGAPVITLAQLAEVEVEVQIDQQYIDQIAPGRSVTLQVQGTGRRDGQPREWTGEVDSIVPRSNWQNGSRSFPVIVRIKNEIDETVTPPIPALREGMMAEATFHGEEVQAILVPKDSMVRTSRGTFVYIINPAADGQPLSVRQVLVEPGLSSGTWIQITGENLVAGMQVVTEGAERLRAFQTVSIVKEDGTAEHN